MDRLAERDDICNPIIFFICTSKMRIMEIRISYVQGNTVVRSMCGLEKRP